MAREPGEAADLARRAAQSEDHLRRHTVVVDVLDARNADRATLLVLADLALDFELAQVAHHVAADVADRDLAVLAVAADELDELLAPLLGQLRDRQADQLAVGHVDQ